LGSGPHNAFFVEDLFSLLLQPFAHECDFRLLRLDHALGKFADFRILAECRDDFRHVDRDLTCSGEPDTLMFGNLPGRTKRRARRPKSAQAPGAVRRKAAADRAHAYPAPE
jgi:hypothetical protein